jgi:hypothetical protein
MINVVEKSLLEVFLDIEKMKMMNDYLHQRKNKKEVERQKND